MQNIQQQESNRFFQSQLCALSDLANRRPSLAPLSNDFSASSSTAISPPVMPQFAMKPKVLMGAPIKRNSHHNDEEILRTSSDYDDEDDRFDDFNKSDEFKKLLSNPLQNVKVTTQSATSFPSGRHNSHLTASKPTSTLAHDSLFTLELQSFRLDHANFQPSPSSHLVLRPQHFKLSKLQNTNLRYEVIYKNLLRDFRKFFVLDFNQTTEYIKKKRRQEPSFYIHCLRMYLVDKNIKVEKSAHSSPKDNQLSPVENRDQIDLPRQSSEKQSESGASIEALVFALGSLVYPKEMLKELKMGGEKVCGGQAKNPDYKGEQYFQDDQQQDLEDESGDGSMAMGKGGEKQNALFGGAEFQEFQALLNSSGSISDGMDKNLTALQMRARQVVEVYHYLYRFSVERLHAFVSDTAMVSLFKYYFESQGPRRILKSDTMRKYKDSYLEAGERIIDSLHQNTRVGGGYALDAATMSGTTAVSQTQKTSYLPNRQAQIQKSHSYNEAGEGIHYLPQQRNLSKLEGSNGLSTGSATLYPTILEANRLQPGVVVPNFNPMANQSQLQSSVVNHHAHNLQPSSSYLLQAQANMFSQNQTGFQNALSIRQNSNSGCNSQQQLQQMMIRQQQQQDLMISQVGAKEQIAVQNYNQAMNIAGPSNLGSNQIIGVNQIRFAQGALNSAQVMGGNPGFNENLSSSLGKVQFTNANGLQSNEPSQIQGILQLQQQPQLMGIYSLNAGGLSQVSQIQQGTQQQSMAMLRGGNAGIPSGCLGTSSMQSPNIFNTNGNIAQISNLYLQGNPSLMMKSQAQLIQQQQAVMNNNIILQMNQNKFANIQQSQQRMMMINANNSSSGAMLQTNAPVASSQQQTSFNRSSNHSTSSPLSNVSPRLV